MLIRFSNILSFRDQTDPYDRKPGLIRYFYPHHIIIFPQEMEYNRRPKPFHQKKMKIRRKENRMQRAKEIEHQLPSSNRGNRRDFFKDMGEDD